MAKTERKKELIILIAKEPWQHTPGTLAKAIGVNESTASSYLEELTEAGFKFCQNESGGLFLVQSGCLEHKPLKEPVIRQLEVIKAIAANKSGKSSAEIKAWLEHNSETSISEKTIDRTLQELKLKELILQAGDKYIINDDKVLSHLYLEQTEKTLLLEALAAAEGTAPLPEEAKSAFTLVRRLVSAGESRKTVVYVHGRSPVHHSTVNSFCQSIETAARNSSKLKLLYRKDAEDAATERTINPLGIVYYWVLDKWYVVAADAALPEMVKTYSVENILHCEESAEGFEPPESFNLKEYFKQAWGIYFGDEPQQVKVRFTDYFNLAGRAKEELAHRESCEFTESEAGLIMTDTVQGLEEFAVWLRSFSPGVEVLETPELREKAAAELRKTLALYEGGADT